MDFSNDQNATGHPQILRALLEDMLDESDDAPARAQLTRRLSTLFGAAASSFPVQNERAARLLPVAALLSSDGAVLCRDEDLLAQDAGPLARMTGGAQVHTLPSRGAKLTAEHLAEALLTWPLDDPSRPTLQALSLSQPTSSGGVYSREELAALRDVARNHDMALHLDGVRFAQAVASTGKPARDLIGPADALTFGASRNGCVNADAILLFNRRYSDRLLRLMTSNGLAPAKMRSLCVQLLHYLDDDLWIKNARQALIMADRLAERLFEIPDLELLDSPGLTTMRVAAPRTLAKVLREVGVGFEQENDHPDGRAVLRFMTSFKTQPQQIGRLTAYALAASDGPRDSCSGD